MNKLNVAVIGAGHLGKIHTRLLREIENVELVAVAEPSPLAQQQMIDQFDVEVVSDYQKLEGRIDAAVVATPTRFHFSIAKWLLERGIHVLVEKPLTDSVQDAIELVDTAAKSGCTVAVGHVERFNPAIHEALKLVGQPKYIQAARMSGFTFRSTDIGVVHDLMIHDIDLVNSIFEGQLESVQSTGVSVIGDHEDISQAVLTFSCGGVANLTATRCSFQAERSFQIFGTEGYASVDLAESKVTCVQVPDWIRKRKVSLLNLSPEQQGLVRDQLFERILPKREIEVPRINAILEEQKDWISAIGSKRYPVVDIAQGAEAVVIADQVLAEIAGNAWNQADTIPFPASQQPRQISSNLEGFLSGLEDAA